MGHWLADVQLAGFAPALASMIFNSLFRFAKVKLPQIAGAHRQGR